MLSSRWKKLVVRAGARVAGAAVVLGAGAGAGVACAMETDQFTVPDRPLADVSRDLELKVDLVLRMAVAEANARKVAGRGWEANDFFAKFVYDELAGSGLPECRVEAWLRRAEIGGRPAAFEVPMRESVYGGALVGKPVTLFHLAPTVNLYGHHVGTDKVGHFFQQGYDYYESFREAESKGRREAEAVEAAVRRGVMQEQGIYGMLVVDIYSNADLAANLAGLVFYRNLTAPVRVGGETWPAVLVYRHGRWELNAYAGDRFLRRYVSDHWDEAMNPSLYAPLLRRIVGENVRADGGRWVAFHRTDRGREVGRLEAMKTWHGGMAYGHSGYGNAVTIVTHWFDVRAGERREGSEGSEGAVARQR